MEPTYTIPGSEYERLLAAEARVGELRAQLAEAVALLEMWHQEYHPQPALKDCCATRQFLDRLK